jgi:DNA-binding response OmpR family regulator
MQAKPALKGRILCTEDDPDTRALIVCLLTDHGFEVICTETAGHAVKLAKAQHFNLYLMDNWMPGLSGTELTEKLREFDVATPILFYSAAAYETDKEAAYLAGAQAYLVKPAHNEDLIAEVVRLVDGAQNAIKAYVSAA